MGKSHYLGGSTLIGFSGSFTGKRSSPLAQRTDVDAHLTQKQPRDQARAVAEMQKKKKKKKPADQLKIGQKLKAKIHLDKVKVKGKSGGLTIPEQIAKAENFFNLKAEEVAVATRRLEKLTRELGRAKAAVVHAKNLPRKSVVGQAIHDGQKMKAEQ